MSENYHYLPLVKQFLPPEAEVFELTEPDSRIAIFTADLDGDQIFEIAAAYRLKGDHYVMILKNNHNTWHQAANMKGNSAFFAEFYTAAEYDRFIVTEERGDVTGDGIPDTVFLTANQLAPDSSYLNNITLNIKDGRNGQVQQIPLKQNAGYDPSLFLGDFTGDKIDDILVVIDSGGSGGMIFAYVFSYKDRSFKQIFDSDAFNESNKYEVLYLDQFKAQVDSLKPAKRYILDLQYKGKEYLNEIYKKDGTLKAPVEGWVAPLSGLYPVDFERDGMYELDTYQNIAGRYSADGLGYMMNVLKWDGLKFVTNRQSIAIFGEDKE
ncbi:VCBS repeat-containing protein [Bacillus sp. CMF21]|nr:VCBS repeat-containing protein [Metabacillus dongyingensis]USK30875.1 VCBS repeat-containing protein [Bacillus sp. CMF21]